MAGRRRPKDGGGSPVPPPEFDVDANVMAVYAEMTCAPDVGMWRQRADITAEWAVTHDVELHPEWGGKVPTRWTYDDTSGRIVNAATWEMPRP